MKKVLTIVVLALFLGISTHADSLSDGAPLIYEEIDPVCSISGRTHIYPEVETSDTSSWSIPKAYDGECENTPILTKSQKEMINKKMIDLFKTRDLIAEENPDGYILNSQGQELSQNVFFPAVQKYIQNQMNRSQPNTRAIAILNYAVSLIGYDYYISIPTPSDDYVGLSVEDARELAESNNVSFRVVEIDGESRMMLLDYRPGRISASVKNNIVISYTVEDGPAHDE